MIKIHIAVILSLFFLFSSATIEAKPPEFQNILDKTRDLELEITSFHKSISDKILFFIEDAHCNYTAQKELSAILRKLIDGNLSSQIAVEGSQGEILTQLFATFPNSAIRRKLADNLLKISLISGEEYFCIYNGVPIRIYGVDEENLYRENIGYFRKSYELSRDSNEIINKIRANIELIKEDNFNSSLLKLNKTVFAYHEGKIALDEYIMFLNGITKIPAVDERYAHIRKFMDICTAQKKIDYDQLDTQTRQIIKFITKNLPEEESSQAAKLYYKNLKGDISSSLFYAKLISLAQKTPDFESNLFPMVLRFAQLSEQADSLNKAQINAQMDLLIDESYAIMAKTSVEKELVELDKKACLLEKLLNLTLSRAEYEKIKGDLPAFINFAKSYNRFAPDKLTDKETGLLEAHINNNAGFYLTASKRDEWLLKNTLPLFESENRAGIILIAGGFHRDKIISACSDNGISCIVISPKTAVLSDGGLYAAVLLRSGLGKTESESENRNNTNLRATSFFAEHSFDDVNKVVEFRNKFIFASVLESLTDFSAVEIYNLIRDWRTAFSTAIGQKFDKNSVKYKVSLALFDHLVTDVFSFGNFQLDSKSRSITVNSMGKTFRISMDSSAQINIEELTDTGRDFSNLESAMELDTTAIKLKNTQVFISAWTIADVKSPYFGHGDAHYSVKYIQALNKRSIEPVVILPENKNELTKTLAKYKSALAGTDLKFKFALYDESKNQYIELDINGLEKGIISVSKKPVVIQLCSKIDSLNNERLKKLDSRLSRKESPVFIRIPTAGTILEPIDSIEALELHMNPAPLTLSAENIIKTGFIVDQELLDLVKELKSQPVNMLRANILDKLNTLSGSKFTEALQSAGLTGTDTAGLVWTFRYLTEKSDTELSYFMNALSSTGKKQVVFTFYSDKSAVDLKHKEFLKRNFKFIDLQQPGNNNTANKSDILVVNLPPLESKLFKSLMGISNNAVVSGENSLVEGIILNKFGVGPAILFKSAMPEHISILKNSFEAQDQLYLLNKMVSYSGITDSPSIESLDLWQATPDINNTERFIRDAFFDPQTNLLLRKSMSDIVPEVNGLNVLSGIISDLDKGHSQSVIIKEYNLGVQNKAIELVNGFMLDKSLNFASIDGQDKFIAGGLSTFIKEFVMQNVQKNMDPDEIHVQVSALLKLISIIYRKNLSELNLDKPEILSAKFEEKLNKLSSQISIAGDGHLFMPSDLESDSSYVHIFIDRHNFEHNADTAGKPQSEIISKSTAFGLIENLSEFYAIKNLIYFIENSSSPTAQEFTKGLSSIKYADSFLNSINLRNLPEKAIGKRQNSEIINDYKIQAVLHEFRRLLPKYSAKLERFYMRADIEAFAKYIRQVINQEIPYDPELAADYVKLAKSMSKPSVQKGLKGDSPPSVFFNNYKTLLEPARNHIRDLLLQKSVSGDYSINIRSIGSSDGKEAYSLAEILEQELVSLAQKLFSAIPDADQKEHLIQQWIDNWNINVYALDTGLGGLALSKLGIYRAMPAELNFLAAHPEFGKMFSDRIDFADYSIVRANNRLRRWVRPVFADLNSDLSALNATKSELSFMIDTLANLKSDRHRKKVIQAVIDSSNRNYKSFFSYNTESGKLPVGLGYNELQPQTIPPVSAPSFTLIHESAIYYGNNKIEDLSRIFGLPEQTIREIYDPELHTQAVNLISRFNNYMPGELTQTDAQKEFLFSQYKSFLKKMIMELLEVYDIDFVEKQFRLFQTHLARAYYDKLVELDTPSAQDYARIFEQNLDDFNRNLRFTATGHLFMPLKSNPDLYEHFYLDNHAFIPLRDNPDNFQSEVVSAQVMDNLIKDAGDISYIRALLEFIDIKKSFSYFHQELMPPTYNPQNPLQIDKLKDYVALSCLDYFRAMVTRHSDVLIKEYGRADLSAFYEYIQKIKSGHKDEKVLNDFIKISAVILQGNGDSVGTTNFFRSSEDWISPLDKYLADLILQKVSKGDYTLSVRSIGGAIGKEGYSLAAVVEKALMEYAMNKIYSGITDSVQRSKLAKQWVDKWDVKVYVLDFSIQRLVTSKEGLYIMDDVGLKFIDNNKEFKSMIQKQFTGDGYYPMSKMPARLRRWITPVYCDLNDDLSPITRNPAEITFAMNVIPYLRNKPAVIEAIKQSVHPEYKSFVAYNDGFNDPPIKHNILRNQPLIIPPSISFDLKSVIELAVRLKTADPAKIAEVLGLKTESVAEMYDPELLKAAHSLIDRMLNEFRDVEDETAHIKFADNILRSFVSDYVSGKMKYLPQEDIMRKLAQFRAILPVIYNQILIGRQTAINKELTENFTSVTGEFLSSVEISGKHLFIPAGLGNKDTFEHVYLAEPFMDRFFENIAKDVLKAFYEIDWNPQEPLSPAEEYAVSEFVSAQDKNTIISNNQELEYAVRLLEMAEIKTKFPFFASDLLPVSYLESQRTAIAMGKFQIFKVPPRFITTGVLFENLKKRIAFLSLPYFRDVAKKHANVLSSPDIKGLYEFINSGSIAANDAKKDCIELENRFQFADPRDVITNIFRESEFWLAQFEEYLDSLIIHKSSAGDFSICAKSIGCSIGKETYSIAAVIERALDKYARKHIALDIADESERNELIAQWIDKWNVKIYAMDINYQRVILAQEGNYLLGDKELDFLETHPDYKQMFKTMVTPDPHKKVAYVKVNDRIKSWVVPVVTNLSLDPSVLEQHTTEISFAMNILPYLDNKKRPDAVNAIINSSNPHYKSFIACNGKFYSAPVDFGIIKDEPFSRRPSRLPDKTQVYDLALNEKIISPIELARILGITHDQLFDSYGFHTFYHAQLLVDNFEKDANLISDQSFQNFFNTFVRLLISEFALKSQSDDEKKFDLKTDIANIKNQIQHVYRHKLLKSGSPDYQRLADTFIKKTDAFFDSIEIVGDNHVFIPYYINATLYFEHLHYEHAVFSPAYEKRNSILINRQVLSEQEKNRLRDSLKDMGYIKQILEIPNFIDFKQVFSDWSRRELDYRLVGYLPNYSGTQRQIELVKEHVAYILVPHFNSLVLRYSPELNRLYGKADLESLLNYLKYDLDAYSMELLEDLNNVRRMISEFSVTGATWFFRGSTYWLTNFSDYLDSLIAQKTAVADLQINVSSIGSSYGKEPYAIAAVVETALKNYARKYIYQDKSGAEQDQLIQQWIDRWNINIYAVDKEIQKLVTIREGVYLVSQYIGDTNEYDFFETHPEYKQMFSEIEELRKETKKGTTFRSFAARVKPRLRNWVKPVLIDLANESDLAKIPALRNEAIFAFNSIAYLAGNEKADASGKKTGVNPQKVIETLTGSFNPGYKSFFAHALRFNAPPEVLDKIGGQPYTLPLSVMPDIRIIGSIAKKHNIKDVQAMLDFLGLKEDINGIVKLYFDSCEQITKMVTGFFNVYQDKTVQSSIQQKFIDDSISSLAVDIVTESIENGYEEKDIRLRLDSISKLIAARFREQLTALNIKDPESALSNFDLAVNSYFKNISVINGHAFIPYTFEGRRIFRHIYLLQNNFHPDSSLRGSSEIVSVSISAVEKQMLVDELSSVNLAKRLIGNMNLDSFAITDPEISLAQYNPANTYQRAELADDIARFSIPYFREIVIKYSDELFARYGISDLRSLADYADYLESEEDYSNPLSIDVRRIASALKNKEETVGATALFRASIRWLEDTENYLNDIIMQKFASGDYSLTVRDLGSSTGKEAYSIAAVIQQALKRFAQAHLYTDEKSDRERARLIEEWIDNWDIKIFAFDLDFQRLLNVKNGVFILDEEELSFLNKNPQYKGMFSAITGNTATASSRLRKWIKPVYIDLDKDIRILNRYPGEITFAMNLMKYLKSPEEMVAIVKTTSNPVYKSLVVFNRKTYLTPQDHNVFRDQPYVLPPRVQPNVNIISSFVQKTGIASVSTISSIFGLTPAQTADIFESSAILPGGISIDSANKSKRLIESMI